jgi:hypothetical protein
VTPSERETIIELISYLHQKKQYKVDTFHVAVAIMDRYFRSLTSTKREAPIANIMATVSLLLAAKLEQSISPSFNRMINTLPHASRDGVTKPTLILIEFDIIMTLQFDL